jgi:hypothetical protein
LQPHALSEKMPRGVGGGGSTVLGHPRGTVYVARADGAFGLEAQESDSQKGGKWQERVLVGMDAQWMAVCESQTNGVAIARRFNV